MINDTVVAYVLLLLTLVAICSHARARDKDLQDSRIQDDHQTSLLRSLEQLVNKRGCLETSENCTVDSECCSNRCSDYDYGAYGRGRKCNSCRYYFETCTVGSQCCGFGLYCNRLGRCTYLI